MICENGDKLRSGAGGHVGVPYMFLDKEHTCEGSTSLQQTCGAISYTRLK